MVRLDLKGDARITGGVLRLTGLGEGSYLTETAKLVNRTAMVGSMLITLRR